MFHPLPCLLFVAWLSAQASLGSSSFLARLPSISTIHLCWILEYHSYVDTKQNETGNIIIIFLASILSVIFIIIVGIGVFAGMASHGCSSKEKKLEASAQQKQDSLSALTIISGQQTSAQGSAGGDCLTGSDDTPAARADIVTSLTSAKAQADVQQNLSKEGYTLKDTPELYNSGDEIYGVSERYSKETQTIDIEYRLADTFICAPIQNSPSSPVGKPGCDATAIANLSLKDINVTYY
ncbi:MAG: hypothetical protein JWL89_208 [Candidatus Saccharibacteria bacterium]|nr:hypothetical protein [Candidatus Saccharibacteria bacterium]